MFHRAGTHPKRSHPCGPATLSPSRTMPALQLSAPPSSPVQESTPIKLKHYTLYRLKTHSEALHAWCMHWRTTTAGDTIEVAFWCCLKTLVQHEKPASILQGCMMGNQRCFQTKGTNKQCSHDRQGRLTKESRILRC